MLVRRESPLVSLVPPPPSSFLMPNNKNAAVTPSATKNLVLKLDPNVLKQDLSEVEEQDSLYSESNSSVIDVITPDIDKQNVSLDSFSSPSGKLPKRTKKACPCGKSDTKSTYIICAKCKQNWHNRCCNLTGLTQVAIKKLEFWQCPSCYVCPLLSHQSTNAQADMKLIKLQMNSLLDTTKINQDISNDVSILKAQVAELVKATSDKGRNVELPQSLNEAIKKVSIMPVEGLANLEKNMTDLREQMTSLQSSLVKVPSENKHRSPSKNSSNDPSIPNTRSAHCIETKTPCEPFIKYQKDIVSPELKERLTQHVTEIDSRLTTVGEGSREVFYYGEYDYTYSGVKHEKQAMPGVIKELMSVVMTYEGSDSPPALNSCLITRYSSGSNHIPFHRDDEPVIDPESRILTVSIGGSRSMSFVNNDKSLTNEILLEDRSVLISSRYAQDFWKHSIPPEESSDETRISFTFRNISPHFLNSTKILGDSNSAKIKFGTGSGNLGAWVPGRREKVGHIEALPEATEIGPYRNLIIHTGINSINTNFRKRSHSYLQHVLESRCREYLKVYPKLKIYISTLLPTRIRSLNREVELFNRGILDICYKLRNTHVIENSIFGNVLSDEHGRWNISEQRPLTSDVLHLGKKGIRMLAVNFKSAVLQYLEKFLKKLSIAVYTASFLLKW